MNTFRLPDLGEGLTEAEIIEWRVAVGDEIAVDQIVVVVETAKAAVDVPCPYAGRVTELHGQPGTVVDVGAPLISVAPAGTATVAAVDRHREEERAGSGNVLVGYGTREGAGRRRRRVAAGPQDAGRPAARTTADEPAAPTTATGHTPARPPAAAPAAAPLVISPIVRRLARQHGVDLAALAGTGPGGIVLRRDVQAAVDGAAAPAGAPAQPVRAAHPRLLDERVPLRGHLRAMADRLSRSRREIPDATTWVDVDATGLLAAKAELQAGYRDHRVGVLALLARIVVAGLLEYPQLNARVDGDEIVRLPYVHLGFAAQTDRGLVVPVVRDAHAMSTVELADELARLTGLAREGRLGTAELTGGTFTLNNYGVYGVDGSTPIINHPEAAMLGVGRIVDKPWVVDGQLAVRKVTQLSFTFDHRVCDGGIAGGFLRYVADRVERPLLLLG